MDIEFVKLDKIILPKARKNRPAWNLLMIWLGAHSVPGKKGPMSQAFFAKEILGVSATHLNALVLGKGDRGTKLARQIEEITGISADLWKADVGS